MPRNVKESDDECETKGGRRTRTMLNPSVLDSPLRRSSRIRQPVAPNDLSPEYNSDVSVTSGTKSTRRRTTALDTINPETQKNLRTRRNSATSDISELAENDSAVGSTGKRITRRSIATIPSVDAPSKLPPKTRRSIRAGSETKSTPPVGRVTRRTRASSMEPEVTDNTRSQKGDTPPKLRKRASAMPSEPAVAEESEDSRIDKTVFDIDEDESETSPNVSKSSCRKSKGDTMEDEKIEVDETHVMESEVDTTDKSYDEKTEGSCKISISSVAKMLETQEEMMDISEIAESNEQSPKRQSISSLPKDSSYTIENLLNKSTEPGDESPSNKENKISNTSVASLTKTAQAAEIRVSSRKSLNSSFSKISEKRCSVTLDTELVSVYQETKKIAKAQEVVASNSVSTNEVLIQKDCSLDAKCVVVIEPIDAEQMAILKSDSSKICDKQQPVNVEEKKEEISKISNKVDDRENITDEIRIKKIIDVIDLAEEIPEEQKEKTVKDADDLQINEITYSSQTVSTMKASKKASENKKLNEESSTTEPIEELTISESLTDEETSIKLVESEENNEIIFCDETTRDSIITFDRDRSLDEKGSKDSQENLEISCETVTTTIIPEAGEDEEISSKPDEEIPSKPEEEIPSKPEEEIPSKPEKEIPSKPEEEISSKPEKEIQSCKIASPSVNSINRVSTDIEMPKECDDSDENVKIIGESLKDRNSSIVTESPVRGTNAEESLKESDATEKRRSVGKSGNEPAENKKHVETNEESDGMRVFESDDGSESIVCPSFQDIPADEWADRENNEDNAKSNNDGDSIHSYSTERNESECDIALVDKEPWQPSERNERVNIDENTNYDSDDTIIAKFDTESNIFVEIGGKRVDGKKVSEDERVNEETPMDVSSDAIDDNEQEESNVSKKAPKKRSSLDNSMKHRNENEKILENRASKSPLNVSRRKSLVEDDVNDSVDPIANSSNESLNKSLKKRSLNALQQNENSSDDECNFEINESKKPPKSEPSSRKSLLGSAKKSDSSILDVSNPENRKSLNKYGLDSQEIEGFATEEIEKKSRRSESKRNSLNNSKVEQASLDFDNEEENDSSEKLNKSSKSESNRKSMNSRRNSNAEEIADLTENLNQSSKSESNRKSMNSRRNSKNAEETANPSENLNKSSKSDSIQESLDNGKDTDVELESSGSEIDKFENLLQQLNESTKSINSRKLLNNKNSSKIQEQSSDSGSEEDTDSPAQLNRSTKSTSDRKSLNNKNTSTIQEQNSDSKIEEDNDSQAKMNRSSILTSDRKSLNKNTSKIQEQSSESEIEEETVKLNRSSKLTSDRKLLNNKNTPKIQEQSSDSEIEEDKANLNRSSKSTSDRKSLNNKNTSKVQEQSSESEMEKDKAKLNRSSKSTSDRKSLNNKNTSKIQEQSSDSEMEEETDSQAKLNRSSKSTSDRKSLNNKNTSKIQEQCSESEIEEDKAKLNRSSKSTSDRKSLNNKNTSEIQEQSSVSEMEEETDSQAKLNRSSKSTSDRKSLNSRNSSKIQEQSSESEIGEETAKLNRSSKSTSDRKSLTNKRSSKIREQSSDSEMEQENDSQAKMNRSSKSSIIEIEEDYNSQVNQSSKPKRKSLIKNKGSITEPVDSENDSESGSSQNANNLSQKLPLFLHEANTSSAEEDSENSIDADIANEINLHGKSSLVYSDDDVAGDDCMVTESESNDSEDDDGEDLKDFVVNDDEYDSEEYRELELGDDEHESSKKARKVKNKKRKRIIPPPKRDSDSSDSENEEETSKPLKTSFSKDDSLKQIKTPTNKKINESLKAKNTKSPISSSTLESDEDSQRLQVTSSSAEKSKTPKNSNKGNDSIQLIEEVINLNESVQRPTKKMQKLLSHSSTPKLSPHKKKTLEKLNSSKSAKLEASKLETSRKSSESENNPTVDTPAKLSMNSKETKTPKTTKSQLHTSLPTELNVSEDKTILSNVKSPKLSALHHTMTTIVGDMSETRFLMKEKLNESLPTLKLAQRAKELRRSALYKLWEEKYQKDENEKENVATIAEQSIIEAIVEPEVAHVEKKKKNKKKKKGSNKEVVEDPVTLNESQQSLDTDVTSKKSKKRKKNKKQVETMEIEETEVNEPEEVPKKKKQKKPKLESNEEIVQEVLVEKKKKEQERNVVEEIVEGPKSVEKKKKKKKKKQVTIVEPEVTIEDSSKTPKKSKTENTMNTGNIKIIKSVTAGNSDKLPTSIKRLPEDILDSLSHSFERPKKRRKIVKGEQIILPSKRMFNPGGETSTNIKVDDDYISLSSFGGTTQFQSVDLSKLMKKTNKKSTAVQSFRERMLSRNPRQPISAYLMYQQKQKIAGKDKLH